MSRTKFIAASLCQLLLSSHVFAAIAPAADPYQEGGSFGAVNSVTTAAMNVASGNTILFAVERQNAAAVSIVSNDAETCPQAGVDHNDGSGNIAALFICVNAIANAAKTYTATLAGGGGVTGALFTVGAYQFSGMGATSGYASPNNVATGNSTTPATAALAPTSPEAVILMNVLSFGNGCAQASGWTGHENAQGAGFVFSQIKIVSASTTPTLTCTSGAWGAQAGIFNGPAAAAASNQGMMSRGAQ